MAETCQVPACRKPGIRQQHGWLACEEHEARTGQPLIPHQLMVALLKMVERRLKG